LAATLVEHGLVRHLIGGPAHREVRRWRLALDLSDRGLDRSPDSFPAVCDLLKQVAAQFWDGQQDSAWWGGWAMTSESLWKYIVALFSLFVRLSRLTRPDRSSVFGTMHVEHLFSLVRCLNGTDQGVECLERVLNGLCRRVRCNLRHHLRLLARHGAWTQAREAVPFFPLPEDFAHHPSSRMCDRKLKWQCSQLASPSRLLMACRLRMKGHCLHDKVSLPAPSPGGRFDVGRAFRVD
jgi:hypothetical protein